MYISGLLCLNRKRIPMKYINDFSDVRNKYHCIYCGRGLGERSTNRDHIPSKTLLRKPYPENLPVIEVCQECNIAFSNDEEYLSLLLECVIAGSTDDPFEHNPKIARALQRNLQLKSKIDKSKVEYQTIGGERKIVWKPEIDRIKRVVLKNARGHALYEFGEPMLNEPVAINIFPLMSLSEDQHLGFEDKDVTEAFWPEVGSRMMNRLVSGADLGRNGWVMVQVGFYRYSVGNSVGGTRVRSVIFEYLATEVTWK